MSDLDTRLELAANAARIASSASMVVLIHETGRAAVAADLDVERQDFANELRHLADHMDGTPCLCGGHTVRPFHIIDPP